MYGTRPSELRCHGGCEHAKRVDNENSGAEAASDSACGNGPPAAQRQRMRRVLQHSKTSGTCNLTWKIQQGVPRCERGGGCGARHGTDEPTPACAIALGLGSGWRMKCAKSKGCG